MASPYLYDNNHHDNAQLLRTGNLKDSDWEKLIEGAGTVGQSRLIIDDTPGISITELRSKCRKYKMEQGLDIIIIDYLNAAYCAIFNTNAVFPIEGLAATKIRSDTRGQQE